MSLSDNPEYAAEQKNKRHASRFPLIVEKIPCGDGQKTLFGYAKNVSRGGLFISTVKPREPGEVFTIELTLPMPCRYTFRCQCEVVWKRHFLRKKSGEPGMGLRFLDISDADGDKIDEWVTAQTTKLSG
ncbi:MAG: PilZ domain-containing protein [Desulfuromonadales bacterium]